MKKSLLLLVTMLMSVATMAQWTKPVPKHVDTWQYSSEGDTTVYYLYNKDAGAFFTEGNAWGTQASIGSTGLKVAITKYISTNGEWDGKTVLINDYSIVKNSWQVLFIDSDDALFVDHQEQANYFFEIESKGDGIYRIKDADINPKYNAATYDNGVYVGMSLLNSTTTSTLSPIVDPVEDITAQIDWLFISEEAYAAYLEEYKVYDAAQTLKSRIDEAAEAGLSTADAEAVYNNTASTIEQLQEATEKLLVAINDYKENSATPDDPKDLTETYIPDADFELNQGAGVWQREQSPQAQNFRTSETAGKQGDATTFLESWHGSNYISRIYVPITGLPNGVYQFTLSAFTNAGEGSYVYAGTDSVEVTTQNMTPYTVFTRVEDGTLEVGLKSPKAIQGWVGIDDAQLLYLGNSVASYAYWLSFGMNAAPVYDDDAFVQAAALEAYNKVLNTDPATFATKDEVLEFIAQFDEAVEIITANAEAYAQYLSLLEDVEELQNTGYEGPDADVLYDYVTEEAESIMEAKALSTEEMLAECEKLSEMIETVKTTCLVAGMDCTKNLTNPNFDNRLTGWSWDESLGTPAWGGLDSNPCVERWNENFNFYQTITGMPNGVYELKVQAFYRPGSDTKAAYDNYIVDPEADEILTYIYANKSEAKVKNIAAEGPYAEPLEDNYTTVGDGAYLPNGMRAASNVFSRGDYDNVVKGVVTDGTLTVGIKCLDGTIEGRWPLWDNFRLTYIGMDLEAIEEVIASYAETVETLQDLRVNAALLAAVNEAYEAGQNAEDGGEAFDALVALIDAIVVADENAEAYDDLEEANEMLIETIESYEESPVVDKATALGAEVAAALEEASYDTAEILVKLAEIEDICAQLRVPSGEGASDETPIDFTEVIVNPSFETGDLTGWTATKGDDTGVKENSNGTYTISNADGSYVFNTWKNVATFDYDVTQTINYLPAGVYELKALLASDLNNKVSLSVNGNAVEFTMTNDKGTGDECAITFRLDEGETLEIKAFATNWFKADDFHLTYFGTESQKELTGVESVATTTVAPVAIYTVSGTKVATLQKGLNIVKMSDNSVRKVLVK